MKNIIKTTGDKIKELRETQSTIDKKFTQADLEEATGISIQSIRAYETNKTIPESKNAKKLADFFNVTVESLLNDNMDIVYLNNIQQTDYSKELGLSNKSIENIKKLTQSLNVFLEDDFCIKFISKVNLLIDIKEHLYKYASQAITLLSEDYKKIDMEKVEEAYNNIDNYFKNNVFIQSYINCESFCEKVLMDISYFNDYKTNKKDENFEYWCNDLKTNIIHLLDELTRTNKTLKYEINEEMFKFLNNITK